MYFYIKDILQNILGIVDSNGNVVVKYSYTAYGEIQEISGAFASTIGAYNPFRYKGYYYDIETSMYYCKSRYYVPEWGRFLTPDSFEYLDPTSIIGLNLFAYCSNDPINKYDPTGQAPWWSWLISGLQVLGGIALCFVPGLQGFGASLVIGGATGLFMNTLDPHVAQIIGGTGSMFNGYGAISTGMSILGLGALGLIGGIALMLVGGATMAFGANEVIAAATGTSNIQQWTGMSDMAYGWTYFGLNLASFVGQAAGNIYNLKKTREPRLGYDGELNGYRYKTKNGKMFDFDYPHNNIRINHFHGWNGPGLTGRTSGQHWNYLRLIWWLISGR